MHLPLIKATVAIPADTTELTGDLWVPPLAKGIVLFAHGSGSSRLSPRNQQVAASFHERGIATLLFDLLSPEEDKEYTKRFAILLLAHRLREATYWISRQEECKELRIGYFGASTGAAAALMAGREMQVAAIVSRGGRPDMAKSSLPFIKAPTLLIVGGLDTDVLRLNQESYDTLNCEKKLVVIDGATHLFEEQGAMQKVSVVAAEWFEQHF
jgi:putative phosphoribosyl transferase